MFKIAIRAALVSFFERDTDLNPKDQAVKRLGVSAELESIGRKGKDKAKTELKGLGILQDSYEAGFDRVIYDSEKFSLSASASEPALTLKEDCLRAALQREKLSGSAVARIIEGAYGTNKAAVRLKVEAK